MILHSAELFNVKSLLRMSQPVLQYAHPYMILTCVYWKLRVLQKNLCYARYEKPLKNHSLEVAKKYVETYSSSNAAAQYPEERAN